MSTPSRSPRVLIVDDDPLSLEIMTLWLGAEGYLVQSACSGDEALHPLKEPITSQSEPHIILADLQMPGLCGDALASALRKVCSPSVRLLAMSATQPPPSVLTHYDAFLLKPFSSADLAQAMQRIAPPSSSPLPNISTTLEPVDEATLSKLRSAMSAQQLTELYAFCLADARSGIVQMRVYLTSRHDQSFRAKAHAIKGSCGMLGATELRTLAGELEDTGIDGTESSEMERRMQRLSFACDRLQRAIEARLGRT